jgi:hypothetical protein
MSEIHDPAEALMEPDVGVVKKLARGAPGDIRVVGPRGSYLGCRAVTFIEGRWPVGLPPEDLKLVKDVKSWQSLALAEQLNTYFSLLANRTLVDWQFSNNEYEVTCIIDVFLDGEELDDYLESADVAQREMERRRQERESAKLESEAAKIKADAEREELVALGKKAKEHNLLEKLRDLEDEIAKLRKQRNKAAKAAGMRFDDAKD